MEEDSRNIMTPLLKKPQIQKQFELLDVAVEEAQKRIDLQAASDPETLRAISVVERFLRKKRRVCYGGQAINALLSPKRKFYGKSDIPDYDFFTPDSREDANELVESLQAEGFTDVVKKVGAHEGTMKVLVNYIPVADCTEMHPQIFHVLQKRARSVDGILYADPEYLRMLMHWELSLPRGQVERWKKVYERLMLLNSEYPVEDCDQPIRTSGFTSPEERRIGLEFCQTHKRLLVGPEFVELLDRNQMHTKMEVLVNKGGPVIFLSDKPKVDAEDLRDIIQNTLRYTGKVKIIELITKNDSIFSAIAVYQRRQPLFLIFQSVGCHGYTTVRLDKGNELRIGMPDTLVHLYYSLWLFGKKEKAYFAMGLECLVQKLYHIAERSRSHPTAFLPAFGVKCSGQQEGIATIMKKKAERTEKEKKDGKKSKTRKATGESRGLTRRRR
jgi:hypothetical protein